MASEWIFQLGSGETESGYTPNQHEEPALTEDPLRVSSRHQESPANATSIKELTKQ